MARLAVFLFAALAFQAVFSAPTQQQQNQYVIHLSHKIQQISTTIAGNVVNEKVETVEHKHNIQAQANELTHDLQQSLHHLQEVITNNKQHIQGEHLHTLEKVVEKLSEIIHDVQKSINKEPAQLKTHIKTAVEHIVPEVEKLSQVAQHTHQEGHDGQVSVSHQLTTVLEEILEAIEILHTHIIVQHKTEQEIISQIDSTTKQWTDVIQALTISQDDVHEVVLIVQHLADELGEIEEVLHHWINNYETDVDDEVQKVAHKLAEIHSHIEKAANPQGDAVPQVTELKAQIKTAIHDSAVHIKELVHVAHSESGHKAGHGLQVLLDTVLSDALVAERNLVRELKAVTGSVLDI